MTGCEFVQCPFWNGKTCTDPIAYVNCFGEDVCGRRSDARPKEMNVSVIHYWVQSIRDAISDLLLAEKGATPAQVIGLDIMAEKAQRALEKVKGL